MPNSALQRLSFIPADTRKEAGMASSWHTFPGAFLVPPPQSAFQYLTCADLRRPFKRAKKWKRKRKQMAMRERLLQPPTRTRSLFRSVPSWKHYRAKRKKADHASTLGTEVSSVQANANSVTPGRARVTKGYFRSLITPWKRKDNQPCLSTGSKDSFTQMFSPKDGASSSPARPDVNPELVNSCNHSSLADTDPPDEEEPPNDELETNPQRLERWGYWNDQYELSAENQSNVKESTFSVVSDTDAHGHKVFAGIGKLLKFRKVRWPSRGSRPRRKRLHVISAPFCDAVEELEVLQVEQHEKLNEDLQLGEHTQRKVCSRKEEPIGPEGSVKTPYKEKGMQITYGCFGRLLARSFHGKLGVVQDEHSDPAFELEKSFAGLSLNSSDASSTTMQVPSILANDNECRSANTPLAPSSARDDGDLAFSNAKMDVRFEQVLKAIDVVANQVKKSTESQRQMDSISADDDKEGPQLSSSMTSEVGTVEKDLSPLRNCISHESDPLVKAFKKAVDDARFRMRVLAGLLTVEKDSKMASARDFQSKTMILTMGMIGAQMLEGDILLEKAWHMKYMLDSCVSSIFFNGPHSSSNCICSRPCPTRDNPCDNYRSRSYDLFCNDIEFSSMTFDSLCDDATVSVELVGGRRMDWSEALTKTFWKCAGCCFHVHKLMMAILKARGSRVQILHPGRSTRFDASTMDPLDTGDLKTFHKQACLNMLETGAMIITESGNRMKVVLLSEIC